MSKQTKYISNQADSNGVIHWSDAENQTWRALVERQLDLLQGRACDEYLQGLELLGLTADVIPQLHDINTVLEKTTGCPAKPRPNTLLM